MFKLERFAVGLMVSVILFICACNESSKKSKPTLEPPYFKAVEGINFIEVRREFDTGLSFSNQGFQQKPEWNLYFLPGDSVKIYSPFEKHYIYYPIYNDSAGKMNFAREWLRLIHVSKDSLVLQLLRVQSQKVNRELSTVYMRFYSQDYIKNKLKTDAALLKRPKRKDTLYVKRLIERANLNAKTPDSILSATEPVELKSKIKEVTVTKRKRQKGDINYSTSDEYLYPEYNVVIHKAYKDFAYSFTALVDTAGKVAVGRFAVIEPEFEAPQRTIRQAVIDVYLHRFLSIKPDSTLGIPHTTEIMLHVKGIKD
ncbi:MAG TPA: hypothetical protein VGB63_07270 [Pedobacter sp.]|jgi:hypothetical protein